MFYRGHYSFSGILRLVISRLLFPSGNPIAPLRAMGLIPISCCSDTSNYTVRNICYSHTGLQAGGFPWTHELQPARSRYLTARAKHFATAAEAGFGKEHLRGLSLEPLLGQPLPRARSLRSCP